MQISVHTSAQFECHLYFRVLIGNAVSLQCFSKYDLLAKSIMAHVVRWKLVFIAMIYAKSPNSLGHCNRYLRPRNLLRQQKNQMYIN